MYLTALLYGSLLFLCCLLVHVGIWRVRIPDRDAVTLFAIFLAAPGGVLAFALSRGGVAGMSLTALAAAFLLHLSLSMVYIASYPAAQAISPSLDILLIIASSGSGRLTEEEISGNYDDAKLVTARIDDLRRSILVTQEGEHFALTPAGKGIVGLFSSYRKALGLVPGEG
jgi:hypothetical protein